MLLSLAAIMLHQSFDWTCCKNKSSLVKNMASVVKGITSTTLSSLQGSHEVLQLASIEKVLKNEPCNQGGLPFTSHPRLFVKTKGTRVSVAVTACEAKEIIKRRYQKQFQERIGVRCFFPEPQRGGNSNTGNVATRVFQNSAISADIFGIPEALTISMWELLKSISSSNFQDIEVYEQRAREAFDLWTTTFDKQMTANQP